MTDNNKRSRKFKIIKEGLLITAIISFIILIVGIIKIYFDVIVTNIAELNAINKILSNNVEISETHGRRMILFARLSSTSEPLNLRNILIGVAGLVTLIFAGWRLIIIDQQKEDQVKRTNIESDRRFGERFDNAANALSQKLDDSSFPAHLGAISSLQTLAIDSPENTQRCLDIICSCNQWMEGYINEFRKKKNIEQYSSWLINEDNRIGNNEKKGEITLLQEKRSQEALVAVSYILDNISITNPEQLKTLKFHNKMLCGISLRNITLEGIDFSNTYLVNARLNDMSLKKAKLYKSHLEGAFLWSTHLEGASLNGAHLEGAYLAGAYLEGASLDYANLRKTSLGGAHLEGASLSGAHLEGASLNGAHLEEASLESSHLEGASFVESHLEGALLDHAHLEGANLRGANLQGASLRGTNLQGASLSKANLQGAFLDNIHLEGASLDNIHLEGVFLMKSNLQGASLNNAHLEGASLVGTNLQDAQLINAKLQGVSLSYVNLSYALLLDCNLYGAILEGIKSESIVFNKIVNIGYIKDAEERNKFLEGICQYMKPDDVKLFTERMETGWQAMDNSQKPDGLKIMKENSIVTKDSQGMYDISEESLANLQKRWQDLADAEGKKILINMRSSISLKGRKLSGYSQIADENVNLMEKLGALLNTIN